MAVESIHPSQLLRTFDKKLLHYIAENRFATVSNLEDIFWNGNAHRNHYRKLKKLEQKGYVNQLIGDRGITLGYTPTKKTILWLKRVGVKIETSTDLTRRYTTTFNHESLLLTLRNIFESSRIVSDFWPEHKVREDFAKRYGYKEREGSGYKVPDALFTLQTHNKQLRVALELELSRKSKARYRKLIKQLLVCAYFNIVFFIVAELSDLNLMKEILKRICEQDLDVKFSAHRHGMYFILLSEFLKHKLDGTFEGEGSTFSLKSLEKKIEDYSKNSAVVDRRTLRRSTTESPH